MTNGLLRERPKSTLGVIDVAFGYFLLIVGFATIGFTAQSADIVLGLWINEALAIALPALIFVRASGIPLASYLGFRLPRARWWVIAAVTALLNQPIVSVLTWLAQSALPERWVALFESKNELLDGFFTAHPLSMIAAVAVAAPLGEELFFRGFALPAAARSMRPLFAAILTAALFSAMHVDAVGALGLFEIGFWLAVLRWGSGSILPAMLGHGLNNAIAGCWFLLGLQTASGDAPAWAASLGIDNPDAPPPTAILIIGGVLILAGGYLAFRVFSRPTPGPENDPSAMPPPVRYQRANLLWVVWGLAVLVGAFQLLRPIAEQLLHASTPLHH